MRVSVDQRIIEAAASHRGAVTAAMLARVGVSRSSIRSRVGSGLLRIAAKGVYVVVPLEQPGTLLDAALLALPDAAASHRTAARLHGMSVPAGPLEIVAPPSAHHAGALAIVHRSRHLPPVDVEELDGRRVTTPARTLWDLTNSIGPRWHREVVESQLVVKRPSAEALIACHRAMARRGRKGTTRMRRLLLEILDDEPFPESELERLVLVGLMTRQVPPLRRQFPPPWYDGVSGIVDFADPVGLTIIEADGRRWHATERARRNDLARDLEAARHGWFVFRLGWHEVVQRNESILDEVADVLRRRHAAARDRAA